ncbi:phytanoyl-CoA dioxygenase family protein [Planctomycetota bacterium]|nr:phytanoyl-CoA dioxygenase family protein [Planctomycetota bacterium]
MGSTVNVSDLLNQSYDLTDEMITQFRRDGFIKLKNVLDEATFAYYGEAVTRQVLANNKLEGIAMEDRDTYSKAFIQVGNLWEKCDVVKEFTFSKRLAKIATELMEVESVRLWHDQGLYKEPSGGFTPWHVDQQYWPMLTDRSVTAWIPLQATPLEMGPLEFGAGSQRMNIARELEISDTSEGVIDKAMERYHIPKIMEGYELGEVSFHLGWTLHRAGGNVTNKVRQVHTVIYMDGEQRMIEPRTKYHQADAAAWTPSTGIGEVMADEKNPVLY